MWRRALEFLLYWLDPTFRRWVDKKRGPDDQVHNGETVVAVLIKGNGVKRSMRGRR